MPKIIFKLLLLLLSLNLYGRVAIIAPPSIYEGEPLEFTLVAKGFDIQAPKISEIDGNLVELVKTSQEATLIEYKQATKLSLKYRLYPKNSLSIPSFTFLIDNKREKIQNKKVTLKRVSKTVSKDFDLQMHLNKKSIYLGETAILKIVFSYADLDDYTFIEPHFQDITLTQTASKEYVNEEGKDVEELSYELKAQKIGRLPLKASKVTVEISKNRHTKHLTVYSNALFINVKALPQGISAIGNYKLHASINKNTLHAKKPLTLTLYLEGSGNVDNLDALHLNIKNTTVYEAKSKKVTNILYKKAFTIISEKDYLIPSFSLRYYDKTTNKVQTTATQALHINIIEDKHLKKETTMTQKALFYLLGLLTAGIIFLFYKMYTDKKEKKEDSPLLQKVQKCTNEDTLFKIMVPYLGRDRVVDRVIYALEAKEKHDFKELKKKLELRLNERDDLFFTA